MKPYLDALHRAPELVRGFLEKILAPKQEVNDIARMLAISLRSAYNLCNSTTEFRVLRVGGSIRVPKDSFDAWLYRAA